MGRDRARFAPVWSVPKDWVGEKAFILGGGPSLRAANIKALRGRKVIAVNDAFLRAPWADVLYFADRRWFRWNKADIPQFHGQHIITRAAILEIDYPVRSVGDQPPAVTPIRRLLCTLREPLSRDPTKIAGFDGGSHAVNLAYLFGSRDIVLVGFDMRSGNWHKRHQIAAKPDDYERRFMPSHGKMSIEMVRDGVRVVNATPGSAMVAYPIVSLEDECASPTHQPSLKSSIA